jgi:hypothetical protein
MLVYNNAKLSKEIGVMKKGIQRCHREVGEKDGEKA